MNCDGVRGLLSAYVDGELSAGELLRVEQHLRRCHWCADEVDALRQAIALVASLEEVEVPASFHMQLHERLVALGPPQAVLPASAQRTRRQDFRRWAVPAAAAAALVIGVTGLRNFTLPAPGTSPGTNVNTPVASTETPPKPPAGGEVAVNPNPVTPVGGSTQPAPPDQTAPPQPVVTTPPQSTTTTTTPPVTQPPETNAGPKPQLGSTNPGGISTASVSYLDNVSEPTSTSQKQSSAALTASITDPAALADLIKGHFPEGAVIEQRDAASGVITLQISLKASAFDAGVAFLEERTNATATVSSYDLSVQMAERYQAIADLELQRERIVSSLNGETNDANRALGERQLSELAKEAELAREAYLKLVDQSASGTIEVTLKPNLVR